MALDVDKAAGAGGGGEANTASNQGVGGVGVFKQKTLVDLEFKNISPGSTKITVVDDTGNDEIDIDVSEANLTLDNIGGTLSINKGGTGQTTQTAAFDALAPTTTKGDVIVHNGTDNIRLAVGTNNHVLTADSTEASGVKWAAVAGGSTPELVYNFMPVSLHAVETNFPPLEKLAGTTVNMLVLAFDDSTEEYRNGQFIVPEDLDTSGTVTFKAYVMAKTAAASRNIGLTFGHRSINDSEDFDGAYTDEDTGAVAIDATQDDVTEVTWTETVTNLGWAASDLIIFRISRDVSVASDLVGDMYMLGFAVRIPRA